MSPAPILALFEHMFDLCYNRRMPAPTDSLLASAAVVAGLGGFPGSFAAMDSVELLDACRAIAALRRQVDQFAAIAAGEVAYRSRGELGHQGLAQKAGFVSPVAMIQSATQVGKHEATRMVQMGSLTTANDHAALEPTSTSPTPSPGWHAPLATALAAGDVSPEKIDSIRRVLAEIHAAGEAAGSDATSSPPGEAAVTETSITAAVMELIMAAPDLNPEQLLRAAKRSRHLIDADGIARRDKQQYDLRSVRTWWDANGMHCGSWRPAPEAGALIAEAFQQIPSPRRGGPRFVRAGEKKAADELIADPRTDEQIAADAFTDMIRLAIDADPGIFSAIVGPRCASSSRPTGSRNRTVTGALNPPTNPFPPAPSTGTCVTPGQSASRSTKTATASTSDVTTGSSPPGNASDSPCETVAADSQDANAHPRTQKRTTSTRGNRNTETRTSTTVCCCADDTTC